MLITVASVVSLAAFAVMLLHWRLRGGRLYYAAVSRVGKVIEGVCLVGLAALTVLVLAGRVRPDAQTVTLTALLLLEMCYSSWRREQEHQRKSSAA